MIGPDLVHYLEEFRREVKLEKEQLGVLEMFVKWMQRQEGEKKAAAAKSWEGLLEDIYRRVENYLSKRGLAVQCWSAARWGKPNGSALCLVPSHWREDIFYRLCRTQLRKGPFSGKKILLAELVLDGHKHSFFLPLLEHLAAMERRLGHRIERESPRVEQTGKYRFRLCFPVGEEGLTEYEREKIARTVADFILISGEYVERARDAKTG